MLKKKGLKNNTMLNSKALEQEVKDLTRDTEDFITLIFNFIETLKQDDIDRFRNKARKILS